MSAVKVWLSDRGINRSLLLRVLVRLGHPRSRAMRAEAMTGRGPKAVLLRRAVRALEQGVLRVPMGGHAGGLVLDMRHIPLSHAHFGAIAFGNLESAVQEAMVRHLGSGDVFYDIGANLGFFSLIGARLCAPGAGHVYAFEPAPDNALAIRRNAALNGLRNITVIDKAVTNARGRGRLQVVDDQSWSMLAAYGEHPLTETVIEVELVSVDELVGSGELPPPTLVKIDVEGAEIDVIAGMAETIARHRPAIICELHGTHREFIEVMKPHDYRLINLEGTIPIEQEGASAHVLALPALHPGD